MTDGTCRWQAAAQSLHKRIARNGIVSTTIASFERCILVSSISTMTALDRRDVFLPSVASLCLLTRSIVLYGAGVVAETRNKNNTSTQHSILREVFFPFHCVAVISKQPLFFRRYPAEIFWPIIANKIDYTLGELATSFSYFIQIGAFN